MAIKEFKLPDVGEGVAEGELVTWLVEPGDRVEEDQPVAEVETDKALVEVPSRYDGVVEELFAEEGEIVPVGNVIISFRVDEDDEAPEPAPDTAADPAESSAVEGDADAGSDADPETDADASDVDTPAGRTFAPPSVRRLARELGVDLAAVDGSGPGGRVNESDVRAYADGEAGSDGDADDDAPSPKPVDIGSGDRGSAVTKRGADTESDAAAGGTAAGGPTAAEPAGRDRTLATPATRKLARELGVEVDDVPTDLTREGEPFVDEAAVRAYAEADTAPDATAEATDATETAGTAGATAGADTDDAVIDRIPYRGVRRTIGQRMEQSKFTAPHVTHHDTAEVDALVDARAELKPKAEAAGVKLT